MIQRIQSIFLFLAASFNIAFLFLPFWAVMNPDMADGGSKTIDASPMHVEVATSQMSIDNPFSNETFSYSDNTFLLLQMIVVGLVSLLLLVNIFMYGNRGLQIKLGYGAIVLLMAQFLLMIPIRTWIQDMAGVAGASYQSVPQFGLAAPVLALIFTWWAIKRIQKDEKMVQGMDRLR
mgnify:CR=1 FL=1